MLAFGTIIGVIRLRQSQSPTIKKQDVAEVIPPQAPITPITKDPNTGSVVPSDVTPTPETRPSVAHGTVKRTRPERRLRTWGQAVAVKLLPGELRPAKTIADLDSTIKSHICPEPECEQSMKGTWRLSIGRSRQA